MKNCDTCKFALEHRNHVRLGEQVRCGKAEELFGVHGMKDGKRWVNVLKSPKTGNVINAKCGTYESALDEPLTAQMPVKLVPASTIKKVCSVCHGTGKVMVRMNFQNQMGECHTCKGAGRVDV